jgi:hypothetical protein
MTLTVGLTSEGGTVVKLTFAEADDTAPEDSELEAVLTKLAALGRDAEYEQVVIEDGGRTKLPEAMFVGEQEVMETVCELLRVSVRVRGSD